MQQRPAQELLGNLLFGSTRTVPTKNNNSDRNNLILVILTAVGAVTERNTHINQWLKHAGTGWRDEKSSSPSSFFSCYVKQTPRDQLPEWQHTNTALFARNQQPKLPNHVGSWRTQRQPSQKSRESSKQRVKSPLDLRKGVFCNSINLLFQ